MSSYPLEVIWPADLNVVSVPIEAHRRLDDGRIAAAYETPAQLAEALGVQLGFERVGLEKRLRAGMDKIAACRDDARRARLMDRWRELIERHQWVWELEQVVLDKRSN